MRAKYQSDREARGVSRVFVEVGLQARRRRRHPGTDSFLRPRTEQGLLDLVQHLATLRKIGRGVAGRVEDAAAAVPVHRLDRGPRDRIAGGRPPAVLVQHATGLQRWVHLRRGAAEPVQAHGLAGGGGEVRDLAPPRPGTSSAG